MNLLEAIKQRPWLRVLLAGLAGFLFYGGWGFYVNSEYGMGTGLRSGITQGLLSFTITAVGATLMESLFRIGRQDWQRWLLSAVGSNLIIYSIIVTTHWLVGTPEIFLTILPGLIVGTIYSLSYTKLLFKLQSEQLLAAD